MTIQQPLFPVPQHEHEGAFGDGVRYAYINGEPHFSIYDIIEKYTESGNPRRDLPRILARLKKQGHTVPILVQYHFTGGDGKRKAATPVVTFHAFSRIAQVADFREWEGLRDRMAQLMEADITGKPAPEKPTVPFPQTKEYRRLIDAGYTHQQAMSWHSQREGSKEIGKQINAIRMSRGATGQQLGQLENEDLYNVTGKDAKHLRREAELTSDSQSTRDYLSEVDLVLLNFSKSLSGSQHILNDSQGVDELTQDTRRVRPVIHAALEKIAELGLQTARRLKAPKKAKQLPLLGDGKE